MELSGWLRKRLELARAGQASLLEPERQGELDGLAAWAARTTDGSLADLADEPSDDVWDEVSAEPDLCTRLDCPHFDRCFLFAARRRAAAPAATRGERMSVAEKACRSIGMSSRSGAGKRGGGEAIGIAGARRRTTHWGEHFMRVAAQRFAPALRSAKHADDGISGLLQKLARAP